MNVIDGGEVALEVLQAISFRNVLKQATIVSFNMQDYDFWGHGSLSHLLLRQLSLGASVRLMTTPPPGKPTNAGFKAKYALLSGLVRNGVNVFLNEKLHAKAYLFLDDNGAGTAIIGSANLTGPGFGMALAPHDSLVEMAIVTNDSMAVGQAHTFVDAKIIADHRTVDFGTWFSRNSGEIGKAGL
ncbi:MAG: phospholipase D family protein [Terriglobales bacterium]